MLPASPIIYALQNASVNSVNARYNWWGDAVTAEMDTGGNPKNIGRIYDVYDNSSYGTVDYAGWLSGAVVLPSQALSKITSPLDGAVLKTAELRIQGIAVAPAGCRAGRGKPGRRRELAVGHRYGQLVVRAGAARRTARIPCYRG